MGAQAVDLTTLETKRKFFEDKMISEGKDYLLYKHYHLGERTDFKKLIHINNLYRAYSSENCNVQDFINKQLELKHDYLDVDNERRCEEFDICYNEQ